MANGRTLEQAEKQLAVLAEENRRLAGELEALQAQAPALEKAAKDARAQAATAEQSAATLKTRLDAANKQVADLQETNKTLNATVTRLNRQVEKQPLNPLTVEEASVLFDRVVTSFGTSKTLEVREANLKLKLATAKIGDTPVLLLPDPKTVDPATLHELTIDLSASVVRAAPDVIRPIGGGAPEPPTRAAAASKKAAARKKR